MRVRAFAKINLSLRVVATRDDGYHELRTIFQSIALHDTLTFARRRGAFALTADDPACPSDDTNLIWRAADRMWNASGRRGAPRDVAVQLKKRIPLQAGLGGGSSDAAAALRVFARFWRVADTRRSRCGSRARRGRSVLPRRRNRARPRSRRPALPVDRSPAGVGGARAAALRRQHERGVRVVGSARRAGRQVGLPRRSSLVGLARAQAGSRCACL